MAEFEDYMTPEQREAYESKLAELSREDAQRRWEEGPAGKLCDRILKAYQDYEDYLKRNYSAHRDSIHVKTISQDLYLKLRENLAKADEAERCIHIKSSGLRCGSPRMNKSTLCFAHARLAETRPESMDLPPLEDANSVQLAIMKVAQWVIDGKMDPAKASKVAYIIQVAANNVGRVNFEEKELP